MPRATTLSELKVEATTTRVSTLPAFVYAVVRGRDGREWIDTSSIGLVVEDAIKAGRETDKAIPHYAKVNPIVRIIEAELREVRTL